MELTREGDKYINGFGELAEIENKYIYPLLKSSDLGNNRLKPRKYVVVTQKTVRDNTEALKIKAPKTWSYLERYANILEEGKVLYMKSGLVFLFSV